MMRQSRQAVLPEISGNKTSSLRKSICSDLLTLFNSPHSALPSLLVSGMPEWQVHNQSDKHLQSWYCRQLRSALLFHEPRIAALQVNLKEAYSHTLAISLEIMLYHDDEPLTFDLVWDNGGWRSATLENVSYTISSSRSSRQKRSATGFMRVFIRYA